MATRRPRGTAGIRRGSWRPLALAVALAAAVLVLLPAATATGNVTEDTKLTASNGTEFDGFGSAVSLDGDTALVGAENASNAGTADVGAAYVYVRNSTGAWIEQAKLTAGDGEADDHIPDSFGASVSLDGDTALVGAPDDDNVNGDRAGAAYVFTRDSTGAWSRQARLLASDGAQTDRFGASVSLDGDRALVGAQIDDNANGDAAGSAYVFTRDSLGSWSEQQKLTASDGEALDQLGTSVDLDGDQIVVGAPGGDNATGADTGAAYVFTRDGTGTWSEQQKLTASDGEADDDLGWSVSLDGNRSLAGAPGDDNANGDSAGAAYAFARDGTGAWSEQAKLTASDGAAWDRFGWSVGLSESTVLVGAYLAEDSDEVETGAAYLFRPDMNGDLVQDAKLLARDGARLDRFGRSADLDGNSALVGAPDDDNDGGEDAGGAYLFHLIPPAPPENLTATPGSGAGEIDLIWEPSPDDDGAFTYHVLRSTSPGGPYTEVGETSETSFTDANLDDRTYHYVVTAEDADGLESNASNEASASPPHAAPGDLAADPGSEPGEIDLDWGPSPDDDGSFTYRVYRSTESGEPYAFVVETSQTGYTDGDLEGGTEYHYVVTAVDDKGAESPFSNEASAEAPGDSAPPDDTDDTQSDAGTDGDASDDPDEPTVLSGGERTFINGTLLPHRDEVDAYGTRVSPDTTHGMSFGFTAPPGVGLEVQLVDPNGATVDTDRVGPLPGTASVSVEAPPGEHLQEGVWTTVLVLQDPAPAPPATSATAAPDPLEKVLFFQSEEDDEEYEGERRCDPKC